MNGLFALLGVPLLFALQIVPSYLRNYWDHVVGIISLGRRHHLSLIFCLSPTVPNTITKHSLLASSDLFYYPTVCYKANILAASCFLRLSSILLYSLPKPAYLVDIVGFEYCNSLHTNPSKSLSNSSHAMSKALKAEVLPRSPTFEPQQPCRRCQRNWKFLLSKTSPRSQTTRLNSLNLPLIEAASSSNQNMTRTSYTPQVHHPFGQAPRKSQGPRTRPVRRRLLAAM